MQERLDSSECAKMHADNPSKEPESVRNLWKGPPLQTRFARSRWEKLIHMQICFHFLTARKWSLRYCLWCPLDKLTLVPVDRSHQSRLKGMSFGKISSSQEFAWSKLVRRILKFRPSEIFIAWKNWAPFYEFCEQKSSSSIVAMQLVLDTTRNGAKSRSHKGHFSRVKINIIVWSDILKY